MEAGAAEVPTETAGVATRRRVGQNDGGYRCERMDRDQPMHIIGPTVVVVIALAYSAWAFVRHANEPLWQSSAVLAFLSGGAVASAFHFLFGPPIQYTRSLGRMSGAS